MAVTEDEVLYNSVSGLAIKVNSGKVQTNEKNISLHFTCKELFLWYIFLGKLEFFKSSSRYEITDH